jgi:hypothetical protein
MRHTKVLIQRIMSADGRTIATAKSVAIASDPAMVQQTASTTILADGTCSSSSSSSVSG